MTEQELFGVRDLKGKIKEVEKRLQTLKMSAGNLVPIIDGLPHATQAKSRVERITLMIVDAERELDSLRNRLVQAKTELANKIMCEVSEPVLQTLLVLRYVECLPFKDIYNRMHYTLRQIFRLHDKVLKDVIRLHTPAYCNTK